METTNDYMIDVISRVKEFIPVFINNVGLNVYQELCEGFDNLTTTINKLNYNEIIMLLNCYIDVINKSYGNNINSLNYLNPLNNDCNQNDNSLYCKNYGIKLDKVLANLLEKQQDIYDASYQKLPELIKRVIFDLTNIENTLPRYKIIILFINIIVYAINEYNVGSTTKIITTINNDKMNLYDSKYKCIPLSTIVIIIALVTVIVGAIIYIATK